MKFHERLCAILEWKKMTQKDLAQQVGVTEPLMSKWCRGKTIPKVTSLIKISEALGLSVEILWYGMPLLDSLLERYSGELIK